MAFVCGVFGDIKSVKLSSSWMVYETEFLPFDNKKNSASSQAK